MTAAVLWVAKKKNDAQRLLIADIDATRASFPSRAALTTASAADAPQSPRVIVVITPELAAIQRGEPPILPRPELKLVHDSLVWR